ncbi:hypothetical protein D3C80_2031300 [compost metagenome]
MNTEQIKDFLRPGQEDYANEPVLLDDDAYAEIKLLEKRIEELKRGSKDGSTERQIVKRYTEKRAG